MYINSLPEVISLRFCGLLSSRKLKKKKCAQNRETLLLFNIRNQMEQQSLSDGSSLSRDSTDSWLSNSLIYIT